MSENQATPETGRTVEPCLCREALRHVEKFFTVKSEAAREHFRTSRLEFLKAIRTLIDERIEHLSHTGQPGTKVTVE
ncbi:MAG: hypothetical protein NTY23_12055 [Chloroflexi bacterium]|nr:hypothetical protein [Chloroflexota bacterium]